MDAISNALAEWFAVHARDLPWRRTQDPYAILVSEFMLQQTQVATVLPYYERWLRRFPDAPTLAAAEEAEVLRHWEGLGYYARARNLHLAAKTIGGAFPRTLEGVRSLPGVGRYTAAAVASFALGIRTPMVDANIARVLARLTNFRAPVDEPRGLDAIWEIAAELLPADPAAARTHNAALMELGATLCRAGEPPCLLCPVRRACRGVDPATLPVKRARPATIAVVENCGWMTRPDAILLEQSPGPRWKNLWRLPVLSRAPRGRPLDESSYAFTHHRVHLRVFRFRRTKLAANQRWIARVDLPALAMTSPHRRALDRLLQP